MSLIGASLRCNGRALARLSRYHWLLQYDQIAPKFSPVPVLSCHTTRHRYRSSISTAATATSSASANTTSATAAAAAAAAAASSSSFSSSSSSTANTAKNISSRGHYHSNKISNELRSNMCGVQLLDEHLWRTLFQEPLQRACNPDIRMQQTQARARELMPEVQRRVKEHLKQHDLWDRETPPVRCTPAFALPELVGGDIESHFEAIAKQQSQPIRDLAEHMAATRLPPTPHTWEMRPGWTRYGTDGDITPVAFPTEEAVVFDVEWCVREGHFPVMATAVSSEAWYGWVSQRICQAEPEDGGPQPHQRELIPLGAGTGGPRVIIGHNVGVDRARVLEEYRLSPDTDAAFIDTMSLHMITSGLSGQQRAMWQKHQKPPEPGTTDEMEEVEPWIMQSSPASLAACSELWLGKPLDKQARDLFVTGTADEVRQVFQEQMAYCAGDVATTHELFSVILGPTFDACPHPASFAGMLAMGKSYLPVDATWEAYLRDAEAVFEAYNEEVSDQLKRLADEAAALVAKPSEWNNDPWLQHLDWTAVPQRYTKARYKKDGSYAKNGEPRPIKQLLPGKPAWYRALWDSKTQRVAVNARKNIAPYLLRLEWVDEARDDRAYPLYRDSTYKWGYLVPHGDPPPLGDDGAGLAVAGWEDPEGQRHERFDFVKLPHKDGPKANCGNPLSKEYIRYLEAGRLRSAPDSPSGPVTAKALENSIACSYWSSARDRILSQFVVWEDSVGRPALLGRGDSINCGGGEGGGGDSCSSRSTDTTTSSSSSSSAKSVGTAAAAAAYASDPRRGAILPPLVAAGTVTRRAVERTWLTASNPKANRIGSELKSKVVAPEGFKFVGADVDSQELWIASLLGDAHFAGMHGATALGWMTLQGAKADGTDMHSRTAEILGISRDQAKVVNYGRIYGAGQPFAVQLLHQFNPDLRPDQAEALAEKLYTQTKGFRIRRPGRTPGDGGPPVLFAGGTESAMFNRLEAIATDSTPRTPVLDCGISAALQPKYMSHHKKQQFKTSRINWVVQSSAVDYLHLMLTSMSHLCKLHDIEARLCITIHDEVRYIVADKDVDRAAFALHLTNLLVRTYFAWKMKMYDLPQGVAFFSGVDIDTVLRKEVDTVCATPSSPFSPPPGRSVDIHAAGEAVGWSLQRP